MLSLTSTQESGVAWVNIDGPLDTQTSPEIKQKVENLILQGAQTIIVELSKVHFVGSAGLRVFIATEKKLKKIGGSVILFKPDEQIRERLRISGIDEILTTFKTSDELELILPTEKHLKVAAA